MWNRPISLSLVVLAGILATGCDRITSRDSPIEVWPDMKRQYKGKPQSASPVFADGRASRLPVPGTIAKGYFKDNDAYFKGILDNQYIGRNPEKIDPALLKQGQMRFNTYCSPCHDRTGHGQGIVAIKAAGSWIPSNLHDDRIKGLTDGELFTVISQGRRSMPGYRFQIVEHDRWAIVAYLRALQRTTSGTLNDVPQELRADLR